MTRIEKWNYFLGGQPRESECSLAVRSPFNDEVVGETWLAGPEEIRAAADSACRGFEETRKLPAYKRSEILWKIREGIERQKEDFARLICLEAGKPIRDARREAERTCITFSVAAEEAKRVEGEFLDLSIAEMAANRYAVYRPFPVGPILGITPFNFPLNLVAHKLAPAVAVGASFILKPAGRTPLSALKLASVILEAGYPPAAVNVLPCESSLMGLVLADERVKLLSFTGSPAVGWKLKASAGKKKVVLELGGNAGVIVDETADPELAAKRCAAGAFSYAGQSCISVQRVFVHESVRQAFTECLLANVKAIKMGDPLDESVDLGPMIDENAARQSEAWIDEAVGQGAKLLAGGKRRGKFLEPTVLTEVTRDMNVSCREVFAPLLTLTAFREFGEAVKGVNDSDYGLQAGVFTNRFDRVVEAYSRLEVGGVMVNEIPTWRAESMPYGGIKDSGFGREGVRYAMQEMCEGKLLVFPGS